MDKSYHFVEKTAKGPDIAFERIWQLLPDLRTGIVRRSDFGVGHSILAD